VRITDGEDSDAAVGSDDEDDAGSTVSSVGPLPTRQKKRSGAEMGAGEAEGDRRRHGGGDDAESIATSILSSASSMRAVHSKKSMVTLVERTQASERERISNALKEGDYQGASAVSMPVLAPPKVAEHNELRKDIEKVRNLVSNLPYQHRNPVI
jgi:hypothetical protein